MLLFSAVILFAAMTTGRNAVYLLFSFVISFMIVAAILATINLYRLRIERSLPQYVFAGKPFPVETRVTNRKKTFPSLSLKISYALNQKELKGPYVLKLPARSSVSITPEYLIERRGSYTFHGVKVSTTFPPELFLKGCVLMEPETIIVYPRIVRLPPQFLNDMASEVENQINRAGLGSDLYGFRKYQDGDDSRFINWRLSAKTQQLLVNKYCHEENLKVCVVFDNLVARIDESSKEKFELAVTFAASLCAHFIERGFKVKLVSRSQQLPYGEGNEHLYDMLKHLALIEPTTGEYATVNPYASDAMGSGTGLLLYHGIRPPNATGFVRAFDYAKMEKSEWKRAASTSPSAY
jgi:uncharacterized protein (DUF58 family)